MLSFSMEKRLTSICAEKMRSSAARKTGRQHDRIVSENFRKKERVVLIYQLSSFFKDVRIFIEDFTLETFELLKCIISDYSSKDVLLSSTFKDLSIDSLDLLEIVMKVEETLNVRFEDAELVHMKTVEDVLKVIDNKQS